MTAHCSVMFLLEMTCNLRVFCINGGFAAIIVDGSTGYRFRTKHELSLIHAYDIGNKTYDSIEVISKKLTNQIKMKKMVWNRTM